MQAWRPRALTGAAFLLAALMFFARLGELPLIDPDEGRNAEVAREMAESGAWVVPVYNAIPYLDKPALYFRAVALSFSAFGRSEATARLPSALSAAALAVMMFAFCRREYGERAAALAVAVLATTPLVVGFGRLVIFDMPLGAVHVGGHPGRLPRRERRGGRAPSVAPGRRGRERRGHLAQGAGRIPGPGRGPGRPQPRGAAPAGDPAHAGPAEPPGVPRHRAAVVRGPRVPASRFRPLRSGRGNPTPVPHHETPPDRAHLLLRAGPTRGPLSVERAPARVGRGGLAEPRPVDPGRSLLHRVGRDGGRLLLELSVQAAGLHPAGRRRARRAGRAPLRSRAGPTGGASGPPHPAGDGGRRDPQRRRRGRAVAEPRRTGPVAGAARLREQRVQPPPARRGGARGVPRGGGGRGRRRPAAARPPARAGGVRSPRDPLLVGRVRHRRALRGGELVARARAGDRPPCPRTPASPVWSASRSAYPST